MLIETQFIAKMSHLIHFRNVRLTSSKTGYDVTRDREPDNMTFKNLMRM